LPQPKLNNQSHSSERHQDRHGREAHLQRLLDEPVLAGTLTRNLCLHSQRETVSFHMPGHKGRMSLPGTSSVFEFASEFDVTELDGLDDLSYPSGVLKNLEGRIAKLYRVKDSVLSVSGASGALLSAILAVAKRGAELLVPRNAHRSVVHALVLSGLKPRWYEPVWNHEWGVYQSVDPQALKAAIENGGSESVAGVLVVSPTFAGAISDIRALADIAHEHGVPLVVDEAQGTHFLPHTLLPPSACSSGADLVAHSFHKTLGALTQTGAVHIASDEYVCADDVRAAMRLVSTSSPNYVLLSSIEQAILIHESREGLEKLDSIVELSEDLRSKLAGSVHIYSPIDGWDPLHVLLGSASLSGEQLNRLLLDRGIYAEAVLGAGCLLLLGAGTEEKDIDLVVSVLNDLPKGSNLGNMINVAKPEPVEQVVSPREAFFAPCETVPLPRAAGRISADCLAPCPPGVPVCIPGARVAASEYLARDGYLRVLLESG